MRCASLAAVVLLSCAFAPLFDQLLARWLAATALQSPAVPCECEPTSGRSLSLSLCEHFNNDKTPTAAAWRCAGAFQCGDRFARGICHQATRVYCSRPFHHFVFLSPVLLRTSLNCSGAAAGVSTCVGLNCNGVCEWLCGLCGHSLRCVCCTESACLVEVDLGCGLRCCS